MLEKKNIKEWISKQNPKKTFKVMIIILLISFTGMIIFYLFNKPQNPLLNNVKPPAIFENSDKNIQEIEERKKVILKELEYFKNKKTLTRDDSIRIEYLLYKFNNVKK